MVYKQYDLRKDHEVATKVKNGVVYLKGRIMQVWWERDSLGRPFKYDGRETWVFDGYFRQTLEQVKERYRIFIEDHS